MANPEHRKILRKGDRAWNKWRRDNPHVMPNLRKASISKTAFKKISFDEADFQQAHFEDVSFIYPSFYSAKLSKSRFRMIEAYNGNFYGAILINAVLSHARFYGVDFRKADLSGALLYHSEFISCHFDETNFTNSRLDSPLFANCNLSGAVGLEKAYHLEPSTLGIDTIFRSGGLIPETFLRKAGVPDIFVTYAKSLVDNPIEYYSCFISFTEKDDAFSERLYNDMQMAGVRCWRWKEDAKWGRTLRKEIDEAVRYYDKLVVICSENSLKAPAVLEEIERALDKEDALKRKGDEGEVLFPIAIDRYIFDGWEHELKIRLTRKTIGNFYDCGSDLGKYRSSVDRLVRDLNRPPK
jgi:hypothetical protein